MILPPVYFGSNKRNSLQDLHSPGVSLSPGLNARGGETRIRRMEVEQSVRGVATPKARSFVFALSLLGSSQGEGRFGISQDSQ